MPSYQIDENKNLVEPSGKVVKKVFNFTIGDVQSNGNLPLTFDQLPPITSSLESGKLMMVTIHIRSVFMDESLSFINIGSKGETGIFSYNTLYVSISPVFISFDNTPVLYIEPNNEESDGFIELVKGRSGYIEVYILE